ncbi:MAG: arsenate reductase (glutaredoxin) [Pseudomonadota bacterium]
MANSDITIYHNPRCSKSRQTLALLEEHGATPEIIEYLINPPDSNTLNQILSMLDYSPRDLMRKKEAAYIEENLADAALTHDQLVKAMINNPILIERPIVVAADRATIGRPPENVLELI